MLVLPCVNEFDAHGDIVTPLNDSPECRSRRSFPVEPLAVELRRKDNSEGRQELFCGPSLIHSARPSRSPEIAAVKAREEAFRQAELNYDVASARAILADEFVGTWNHGEQVNKDQFLSLIGDKADPLEVLEYGDMEIRVYGNAAVVWSMIHEKAVYGGKVNEYRGRRTAMWVKRNTHWQCVTIHTSPLGETVKTRNRWRLAKFDLNRLSLKTPPGNLHRKRGRAFQTIRWSAQNSFSPSLFIIDGWSEPVPGRAGVAPAEVQSPPRRTLSPTTVLSNFRGADDPRISGNHLVANHLVDARPQNAGRTDSIRWRGSVDRRSMFRSGRSL